MLFIVTYIHLLEFIFPLENQDINRQDSVVLSNGDEKKRSQTPTPSSTAWQSCRKLIYVQRSAQKGYFVGHWPVPEAFWPDPNSPSLVRAKYILNHSSQLSDHLHFCALNMFNVWQYQPSIISSLRDIPCSNETL